MQAVVAWLWILATTSCLLPPALALHASEAGVIDWHKPLVGLPLTSSHQTSPIFHRTEVKRTGATQSLVLTATASNVLAALHPENGTVAWRHMFNNEDRVIAYKPYEHLVAALSGPGGATLRILDVHNGHLIHEKRLHQPTSGLLLEPPTLGVGIAFETDALKTDVFVLTNGHNVRRVDGSSGEVKWGWTADDQTSLYVYSNVVSTPSAVYLVGLAKSFASHTLHIVALNPATGEVLSTLDVPSSISDPSQYLVLRNKGKAPQVAWLEDGRTRSFVLTSELNEKPSITKGVVYKKIVDVRLCEEGQFIGIKEDGAGRVFKVADDGTLKVIWEFEKSATSNQYTESIYTGGLDKDGATYIARVFWSHVLRMASIHVFAPHLAEGKGLVTGFTFPFATHSHGIIAHVALDAVNPSEMVVLSRLVLTTTTGGLQLWQQDKLQWAREEGLADIRAADMVELPESKVVASLVSKEENEGLGSRLVRHLADAQDFPQYAINFARRFATGSYASVSSSVAPKANASAPLSRDTFGLRQIIVAATGHGKVFGIDSANGEIVWSRVFGLGWAAEVGGRIIPLKVFTTRTVNDADGDTPQVVVVAERKANNGLTDTVVFHIDALTGADALGESKDKDVLQGKDVISGSAVDVFLFKNDAIKFVILLDEFLQVRVFPDNPQTYKAFLKAARSLHFPLRAATPSGTRYLTGHKMNPEKEFTGYHIAYPTWTTTFPPDEDVRAIIARPSGPIASYGKVLGNRTTLYKYLNPNLMVVLTGPPANVPVAKSCSIYVVDGSKGSILYHSVLPPTSDGKCDVKAAFTENWLVYHYYDGEMGSVDQAKGHKIVSVEFYEGSKIDDRTSSSDLSSYSNQTASISVYEQSYIFPRGISAITTTSTKYGISMKDILVATDNGQIVSIPRRFLDPRRPKRKPTAEESEEWLMQYDPLVPDEPKWALSHTYQISRTRRIITSPSLLESTSLIFAYGPHDLFSTRSSPSGTFDVLSDEFNKTQLVFTVLGLLLAILVARPMVARKKVKERWYE